MQGALWMVGRPTAELVVNAEDRATLTRWTARRTTAQSLALRSRIILRCATGVSNMTVAQELGVTDQTVCKWRGRFVKRGVAGLLDEPRSGVPRKITDDQVEAVIVKTLESTPRDATHWSTRSMAAATGLSRPTINRIWRAFGLQPHRTGDLQAVARSTTGREGTRHRRPVSQPARTGTGAVR